jgi:formamidopyrimidine-DNA glycosylase
VPELPEVESTRLSLEPGLLGRVVVQAHLRRADICETGAGKACSAHDLLEGATIARLTRHGKQLALIAADGRTLVVQLGMSGSLRVLVPGAPEPRGHVHAVWTLNDGSRLIFRDPRRFGGLTAFATLDQLRRMRWSELGPDASRITGAKLRSRAGESKRAIKAALLDQAVLAGVGNIYADESLFRAGIRPSRRADRLVRGEYETLAGAIRRTLARAIRDGGSTIRDYANGAGAAGRAQLTHAVYGRAGGACLVCGGALRATRIAQRATVYCPQCQAR